MSDENFQFYEFGDYKIDSKRRILTKQNSPVPISSKNLDLLLYLVKNEGRILTHDELLDGVWEGTFVEQSNLKKGISALRHILGETPESSLYITTVPRKGYSFVSTVRAFSDEHPAENIHLTATQIVIEEEIFEEDEHPREIKSLPAATPPTVSFWQRYNKFILSGMAVLLMGFLAFAISGYFTKQGKRFSAEKVRIAKLTTDGNCADASISADGNFVLCGVKTNEGSTLVTRQVNAKSQVQLLPLQKNINFWAFKITPDGNSVYYMLHDTVDSSRDGLFQIPFLGGTPRKINNAALHITFSPDGKKFGFVRIFSQVNQILTANLDGTDEKIIAEYDSNHRIWGLHWSPDGQSVLCSARQQTNEKFLGFVDEISVQNNSIKRVFENEKMIVSAAWMPDKSSIILGLKELNSEVRQIWQYFPHSKELIRVTNDNNTYRFPILNQAGTIISVSQESVLSQLVLGETNNKSPNKLSNQTGFIGNLSRTQDNRFIYNSAEEGNEAVWVMKSDGSDKQQISDGKDGTVLNPKISLDGKTIVFSSFRTGKRELWQINLDGSGLTPLTKSQDEQPLNGRLLADNTTLIGISSTTDRYFLWKQTGDGKKITLADKVGYVWDLSPNGNLLVYEKYNESTKQFEILVQSLENNQILHTFPGSTDEFLKWFDDTSFFYLTINQDNFQIFRQKLDKSPPTLLFETKSQANERITSFELFPDGKKFVFVLSKYLTDAVTIKIDETK